MSQPDPPNPYDGWEGHDGHIRRRAWMEGFESGRGLAAILEMAKAQAKVRELEEQVEELRACRVCGATERGGNGYLLCECPDPAATRTMQLREAEARITDLESQLAAAREEQGLEAKVREVLGERFGTLTTMVYVTEGQPRMVAEWEGADPESHGSEAEADTFPALLRAILEVEAKGG